MSGIQGDKDAKQTQFQAVGRPAEYPGLHYSIVLPSQSGANCAKQSQFRRGQMGRGPGVGDEDAKQSQFRPAWDLRLEKHQRKSGGTPNPQSSRGQALRRGGLCETKPIPGGGKRKGSTLWKRSYRELRSLRASAKQSQFPAAMPIGRSAFPGRPTVRNKANFPAPPGGTERGGRGTNMRNKPNSGSPAGTRGSVVQNKPNFPTPAGALWGPPGVPGVSGGDNCAKQTQFRGSWLAGGIPIIPVFHYSTIPVYTGRAQATEDHNGKG